MKKSKIVFKIIAAITAIAAIGIIALTLWYLAVTKDVLFDEKMLVSKPRSCAVYYSDNEQFEQRVRHAYADLNKIPEITRNAFIAVEDKRFYSHSGIDLRGIIRAALSNVFSRNVKQGGSTISQQLVKNAFLSGDKTIERKFKEYKLTKILEKNYSKDKILEMYLNTVYFGKGIYGVAEAANRYFDKDVSDLNAQESALLAGIIKSPTKYNPVDNYENSLKRKNLVLGLMKSQNFISSAACNIAKNKEIIIDFKTNYEKNDNATDYIKKLAAEILGYENISDLNDYKIYTSINKETTNALPKPADYSLSCDYTIFVADVKTKKITAVSSSAGDLKRCPASAAKPWLIYAPAIEEKIITEATKIDDSAISYNGYSPKNQDGAYHGYVSAKEALAKSYNIPAVKLADSLGTDKIKDYAKKMNVEFSNDDLSVALGNLSGGISLSSLTSCYSPFVNSGKYFEFSPIEKIVNSKGKTVYENKITETQVFSDSTAFLINDMLNETVKNGTAKKLSSFPFEICAKTGTNGNKKGNIDAFCVAYTTNHIVAVRLGNANGKAMDNSVSGGNYPAAMVRDIFKNLYRDSKPDPFSVPDSIEKIFICKDEYENNQKILITSEEDKNSIPYYFAKNNKPSEKFEEKNITPIVKDYKIACNTDKIEISITTDDNIGFYITDEKGKTLFTSGKSDVYIFTPPKCGVEYTFFVTPFVVDSSGKKITGEKIKLPVVKTAGSKEKIIESPWWESRL